jgi:hypothetical protein
MANQTPKGLLDIDMDQAFKDLTLDMDSVVDDLSFRNSTGEVSEVYKSGNLAKRILNLLTVNHRAGRGLSIL